jgi:hypothetical protein
LLFSISRERSKIVIAGLDPAIHPFVEAFSMDARVKPGHDDLHDVRPSGLDVAPWRC